MGNKHDALLSEPDQQRPLIEWELKGNQFADANLSTRAFTNIDYTEEDLSKFVDQASCYCNEIKRWNLPMRRSREDKLANGLQIILEQIMTHFDLGQRRTIYNAYRTTQRRSTKPGNASLQPSHTHIRDKPAFSIQAVEKDREAVNNFPDLDPNGIGFPQTVSPIEVTTESNFNAEDHKIQLAHHARHVFHQQSNRQLVTCFVVSERSLRIYSFGRDGLHYSMPFDIHANPTQFVRIILGAASTRGEVAGFDSTIFFRNEKRWIRSVDCENNAIEYEIVGADPVFERLALGGRGTTCWKVKDSTGNILLVKDSWKAPALSHEYELLQDAKGLGGVGQIVGYQNGLASTHKLRLFDTQPTSDCAAVKEKVLSRIVMEYYGETIAGFTSRKQLLEAFDDAISGYKNLHDKNILHRDISVNNILLGKPGAEFPNRGVLVDLDMAIRLDQKPVEEDKDLKAGTRAFQSINILRSYSPQKTFFPHSYMDDLQSFFYALCWVCANYTAPATQVSKSSVLVDWEHYDPHKAAMNKMLVFVDPLRDNVKITSFFGKPFFDLLTLLQCFFMPYVSNFTIVDPPTLEDACATIQGHVRSALAAVVASDSLANDPQVHLEKQEADASIAIPKPSSRPIEECPPVSPAFTGASKRRFNELEGAYSPGSKKIKLEAPCSVS